MFAASEIVAPGSCVAVVLAGGAGSRLRNSGIAELANMPKALVEIDADGYHQPMLEFVVSGMLSGGFGSVVVLTSAAPGSDGTTIERFAQRRYRDCTGVRVVREAARSGTAGALYAAADLLPGEVLFVVPADTMLPFRALGAALTVHVAGDQSFTWLATSYMAADAQNAGGLLVDARSGALVSSVEDGATKLNDSLGAEIGDLVRLTSAGAVVMERDRFVATFEDLLPGIDAEHGVDLHRQLLPFAARRGEVHVYDLGVATPDLGVPERLLAYGRSTDVSQPA